MKTKSSSHSKCSFGLSSLDLAGEKFSFEFPTLSRKLQTKVGSGLTFVIDLVAVLATAMIGSKYFDTSSPRITFSNEIGPEIPHNLAKELMLPPLTVYMEGEPIQANISKFATINVLSLTSARINDSYKFLSLVETDYVDCNELNDPYFNQIISKIDKRSRFKNIMKCPDFKGNYTLSEAHVDNQALVYKFVIIRVYPCTLKDSSQCVTPTPVKNLRVVAANTKKTIESSNYTHPYKTTVSMDEFLLDPWTVKVRRYDAKVTKVIDLRNEIFGEKDRGQFVSIAASYQDNIVRFGGGTTCQKGPGPLFLTCEEYFNFILQGGSEVVSVKREYHSPLEIMGEIGGVLKVALMFVMVYTIYNQAKKRSFIIESIFSQKNKGGGATAKGNILSKEERQSRGGEDFWRRWRVKVAPISRSTRRSGRQHSKKVKEECYRSATCISNLLQNVNYLAVLESLTLNEHSKKLLSEVILIKRMIKTSPAFRERFNALKTRSNGNKNLKRPKGQSPQGPDENEEEKENEHEKRENVDLEHSLGLSLRSKSQDSVEAIRDRLKFLIENQMNSSPSNSQSRRKSEAKNRSQSQGVYLEEAMVFSISRAKNFGQKGIMNRSRASYVIKSMRSDQNQGSLDSPKDSEPSGKSSYRKDSDCSQLSSLRSKDSPSLPNRKSSFG